MGASIDHRPDDLDPVPDSKGRLPVLHLSFFLESPKEMGREGGIFSTIVGTVALTLVRHRRGAPLGVWDGHFFDRVHAREQD